MWDALTYHRLYAEMSNAGFQAFIGQLIAAKGWTLIPPIILLYLLGNSPLLVVIFNLTILCVSLFALLKHCRVDEKVKLFLLILLNPYVFYCVLAINKEITAISAMMFVGAYIVSKQKRYLLMALLLSFFTRYQVSIVMISFLALRNVRSVNGRLALVVGYIGFLSLIVPRLNLDTLTDVVKGLQNDASTGLVPMMNDLAEKHYLFFLVVLPKVMLNFFGDIYKISFQSLTEPFFYSSMLFLVTLGVAVYKGRCRLKDDRWFLVLLFVIPMSITPFIHHRYFLPIYPLLAMLCVALPTSQARPVLR
jgi:hypothetical protein